MKPIIDGSQDEHLIETNRRTASAPAEVATANATGSDGFSSQSTDGSCAIPT